MSGPEIVGALLATYAPLTALVTAANMHAGALPQGVALPNLLVTRVSRSARQPLKGKADRSTARMQVTVQAKNYQQQIDILRQVLAACDGRTGTIAGFANVSVTPAGGGPDFRDATASIWMGSEDFMVSYPET